MGYTIRVVPCLVLQSVESHAALPPMVNGASSSTLQTKCGFLEVLVFRGWDYRDKGEKVLWVEDALPAVAPPCADPLVAPPAQAPIPPAQPPVVHVLGAGAVPPPPGAATPPPPPMVRFPGL